MIHQVIFDQAPFNMRPHSTTLLLAIAICASASISTKAQTIADAGPDQDICLDTTTMQANMPLPTEIGFWSLTSGSLTITDVSDPTTTLSEIDHTQNVLTWTIITPSDTTTDQVSIIRYWVDPAPADAGPDQTIYAPPFSTTMNATTHFPQVCMWSLVQGTGTVSNPTGHNSSVSDLGLGANVFQWTCDNAPCNGPGVDQVVITVELSTSIGAGTNNHPVAMWFDHTSNMLKLAGDVQANSITIVNAVGQTIELRAKPTAGSLDLNALEPGTYIATARIGGERKVSRFVVER